MRVSFTSGNRHPRSTIHPQLPSHSLPSPPCVAHSRLCPRSAPYTPRPTAMQAPHASPSPSSSAPAPQTQPSAPKRPPSPPIPLPPGATETAVTIPTPRHENLAGRFVDTSSQNVIILCHGYASSKSSPLIVQLATELARRQLSSLRFDFNGNGESDGVFAFTNYAKEVEDLRTAVAYVRETLQRKVAAVIGHSKGGNIVLLYGSQCDDVPQIVNIAGRFDMKRGVAERFGEATIRAVREQGQAEQQDLEERLGLDMEAAARKITATDVLTIHGTADMVIPVEDAQSFSSVIPRHQLALIEGADHNFRASVHGEACVRQAADFIQGGLA